MSDIKTLKYIIEFSAGNTAATEAAIKSIKGQVDAMDGTMRKTSVTTKSFAENMADLSRRALMTIPVWLALRGAMMGIINLVKDGANDVVAFDTALRKMTNVTSDLEGQVRKNFIGKLGQDIRKLSNETGKSVTDISDIYIKFAETGMKSAEAQAGMTSALRLATGTFANTGETARMLVDLYNMFGNSITKVTGPQEKMNYLASLFAVLWRENAGTLNEYIQGMNNFGGAAKIYNLSVEQSLVLITTLNTYMQRAGKAGNQMKSAFTELTQKSSDFRKLLGSAYVEGNQFQNLMTFIQLLENLKNTGRGAEAEGLVVQLFGAKARQGVDALVPALSKVKGLLDKLKTSSPDELSQVLKEIYDEVNDGLAPALDRAKRAWEQLGNAFIKGLGNNDDLSKALKNITKMLKDLQPVASAVGTSLGLIVKSITFLQQMALRPIAGIVDSITEQGALDASTRSFRGRLEYMRQRESMRKIYAYQYEHELTSPSDALKEMYKTKPMGGSKRASPVIEDRIVVTPNMGGIDLREQLDYINIIKSLGYDQLTIEQRRLELMQKIGGEEYNDLKIIEQKKKVTEEWINAVNKYSDVLSSKLESSFKDILSGKGGNPFKALWEGMRESLIDTQAQGLTNMVMSTGIGQMFGVSMANMRQGFAKVSGYIEDGCNAGGKTLYKYITSAINDAKTGGTSSAGIASMSGFGQPGGISSGPGAIPSSFWGTSLIGGSPNYGGLSATGRTGKFAQGGMRQGRPANSGGITGSMIGTAAITGVSAAQSASQGGMAGWGGALTTVGSGMLAMGVGMGGVGAAMAASAAAGGGMMAGLGAGLAAIGPLGWVALAAIAIGTIMSMKGSKSKSTQTQTSDTHVASKIDVSNKKLEMINRNLLALNNTMETYALRDSAYFGEKTSLDAQFALSAKRAT